MSRTRSQPAPLRQPRLTGPRCRGGASSLLRLAQPVSARLPAPQQLSGWMQRAATMMMPVTRALVGAQLASQFGVQAGFAASEFGGGAS